MNTYANNNHRVLLPNLMSTIQDMIGLGLVEQQTISVDSVYYDADDNEYSCTLKLYISSDSYRLTRRVNELNIVECIDGIEARVIINDDFGIFIEKP